MAAAESVCLVTGEHGAGRAPPSRDQGRVGRADFGRVHRLVQSRRLHFLRPRAGRQRAGLGGRRLQVHDRAERFPEQGQQQPHPDRRRLDGVLGRCFRRRDGAKRPKAPSAPCSQTSTRPPRPARSATSSSASATASRSGSSRRNWPKACASMCSALRRMPPGCRSASGSRTISACWRGTTSGSSADMAVDPPPRDEYPALWKYLAETAVLGKRENVPPNLAGEWMRAILTGTPLSADAALDRADAHPRRQGGERAARRASSRRC